MKVFDLMNPKYLFILFFYIFSSPASELQLEWQHYISASNLPEQPQNYMFLKWDQKSDFYKAPFFINIHAKMEHDLERSRAFSFSLPEMSLSYKYKFHHFIFLDNIEIHLGRKIKRWSLADEHWDMGLWNPLNRLNPLHPSSIGLIGSFLTLNFKKWSFDFFLSGIYLPHKEVPIKEKNGRAYSTYRWFNPLYEQVDIFNLSYLDIYYSFDNPYLFDLLFQGSYILSFKTWIKTSGVYYWIKWSFADKPVNHLFFILKKNEVFKLGKEKGTEAVIQQPITTLRVREKILSAEWGFDYKNFSTVFTLENTNKKEPNLKPEGWGFLNQREKLTYFSSLFKYKLFSKTFIKFGYLQSWFPDHQMHSYKIKGQAPPSILRRYKLLNGVSVEGETEFLSQKGLKRVLGVKYKYSFFNEAAWLFLKAEYYVSPQMYTSLTMDVLGAKNYEDYFLNQFRHNDYFSWKLAYVF